MLVVTGCQKQRMQGIVVKPDYDRPLLPGQLALRKITDPTQIPDFTSACRDIAGLREAIDYSLSYLNKPSSRRFFPYADITHEQAVDTLKSFKQLIDSGTPAEQLNEAIRRDFDVYESVGCDDMGTVLFTGYYTPIFDGSPVRTERFQYPLYRQPDDLVKGDDGQIQGRRSADGQVTPYPPRAEIENSNMLTGKELIWLADPFEVYIAHVQGSAKIKMPDPATARPVYTQTGSDSAYAETSGRLITVGYAGNNGREYHSIGRQLVDEGKIPADKLSLAAMIDFFKANSALVRTYTQLNPRFVFFREEQGPPRGSLNEPVTPYRTIATDKTIFPRGCLAFLATKLPRDVAGALSINPYTGFALDQDTGNAIRAAGRCDVYMGVGDSAGRLAGQTYQEGRLYYLFVKPGH
jgi:membrane-bound lytic murein transglycosylase A